MSLDLVPSFGPWMLSLASVLLAVPGLVAYLALKQASSQRDRLRPLDQPSTPSTSAWRLRNPLPESPPPHRRTFDSTRRPASAPALNERQNITSYFKHDEVFPVIERAIEDHSRGSSSHMVHDDIAAAFLRDPEGSKLVDNALGRRLCRAGLDGGRKAKEWTREQWAGNIVAWFSTQYSKGRLRSRDRFDRIEWQKGPLAPKKWAYRVRVPAKSAITKEPGRPSESLLRSKGPAEP